MQQTTKLYEELIKINKDLDVTLRNNPTRITIRGSELIDKDTLWQILKLVDKKKAKLTFTSYGFINIKY